jgi:hypothetical protein
VITERISGISARGFTLVKDGYADRPRHPVKELEAVLSYAEGRGWRVWKGSAYFGMRCPCGQHQRWVHLTPSNPNYERNLRSWLKRQPCWQEETRR